MTDINEAKNALLNYEQADAEGVIVKASRQAIHEIVDELERLTAENERLLKVIDIAGGISCPNCDDEGFTPRQVSDHDWIQEQCEFCYTVPESKFMRAQRLEEVDDT